MLSILNWLKRMGILADTIHLQGEEREGGYIFMTSPELPGFSFMLEPEEGNSIPKMLEAIMPPLSAYLAHQDKWKAARIAKTTADISSGHPNLVAELQPI